MIRHIAISRMLWYVLQESTHSHQSTNLTQSQSSLLHHTNLTTLNILNYPNGRELQHSDPLHQHVNQTFARQRPTYENLARMIFLQSTATAMDNARRDRLEMIAWVAKEECDALPHVRGQMLRSYIVRATKTDTLGRRVNAASVTSHSELKAEVSATQILDHPSVVWSRKWRARAGSTHTPEGQQ